MPGLLGALTMLLGMVVTALSVARERELGTFEQLLVSPLRPVEILIGKAVPAFLIGIGEASLILAIAVLGLSVPVRRQPRRCSMPAWRSISAAVIGVGLFISSLVSTQQQAILGRLHLLRSGDSAVGLRHPGREHAGLAGSRSP